MRRLSNSIRGRLRLLRGHCPACSSDSQSVEGCEVCRGYRGPFPADGRTMQRWTWRFDARMQAGETTPNLGARAIAWSPTAERLAR